MISRCRVILMGRCMIRKNQKKVNRTKANKHRNSPMNKWARLMTINVKKTSRTRKAKPKERKTPMSISRDSKKENRNLLTTKEKKTKKKEKVRTREKTKRTKTVKMRKNEAIGTITMIREIKSTSKRKMLKNTKEMKKTWGMKRNPKSCPIRMVMILANLSKMEMNKWMLKSSPTVLKKNRMKKMMDRNIKIKNLRSKTHKSLCKKKNRIRQMMRRKSKRNRQKTEDSMKEHMVDKTISSKTIILSTNKKWMNKKTSDKAKKMPKVPDKGKKVLASQSIR